MSIDQKRRKIAQVYDSDQWLLKVLSMPEKQVAAIYRTMKERGQIPKKKEKKNEPQYEQLSFFSMMTEEHSYGK